jgi:hypothetical protein
MPVSTAPREHAKSLIDRSIRKVLAQTGGKPRRRFLAFLGEIRGRSDLLRPARYRGCTDVGWLDAILSGLLALFVSRNDWIRLVDEWQPGETNPIPVFSSLAHHLLASYPVPPVLLSAWFQGDTWEARQHQRWFKRAGKGISLRSLGFPIPLSRRMAHFFTQAPAHFPIEFSLRWAQVRGLGGSDALARAVAASRLGQEFENDEFWISAIHFFANHPALDLGQVDPIVEYLHHQKFEQRRVIIGEDTEVFIDAIQPDLCLKGWTVSSMLRRVEEWKAQRKEEAKRTVIRWQRSSAIDEFQGSDDLGRSWTIRELLNSDELAAEGKAMDHCVATYTDWCSKRLTTIWSVGVEGSTGRERVATVEVNPANREVVQAKARDNDDPDESALSILKTWAGQAGLKVEC